MGPVSLSVYRPSLHSTIPCKPFTHFPYNHRDRATLPPSMPSAIWRPPDPSLTRSVCFLSAEGRART